MKPSILITGGAGLLATNWAVAVRNRYDVTLGLHSRHIAMKGVSSRVINLDSIDAVAAVMSEINATVVIHSAAMTSVDACEAAPETAYYANVDIARNVAVACKAKGAKLVHISTDHVFSGLQSMMEESASIAPINVYAKTKAAAEVAVLDACPSAIVLRTNFFGWGLPYRKSFSDTILESLRSEKKIELFVDAFFTPILMESLILAAHDLADAREKGIFHVVGDERLSKFEFGIRLAKSFGFEPNLIQPTLLSERSDLAPRPLDLSLSNEKLCKTLGRSMGGFDRQLIVLKTQKRVGRIPEVSIVQDR